VSDSEAPIDLGTVAAMDRSDAWRLALALRDGLWSSASAERLERLTDCGLNPPDPEGGELRALVWRAMRTAGLAGDG
jgi:hypothetical protein